MGIENKNYNTQEIDDILSQYGIIIDNKGNVRKDAGPGDDAEEDDEDEDK